MKHIVRRRVTAAILAVLGGVMAASALSFGINVLALALVFFLRGVLPFHWAAALIAAAVAVSVIQPYMISRYKPKETAEK